jgi:predicted transcriptional regulator
MEARSFAGRVRDAARQLGRFSRKDLAGIVEVCSRKEKNLILISIRDFVRRGELRVVSDGLYEYTPPKRKRTKMDIIWHLIRSHRQFGLDDMETLSGASRETVKEYLSCLCSLGYLKKASHTRWKLVKDPGPETPVNTSRCEKLKRLRARRDV